MASRARLHAERTGLLRQHCPARDRRHLVLLAWMVPLYAPLIRWAIQHWQNPGQAWHLALDATVLWNRYGVVVLSVVCHGRAIPLLWQTLEPCKT